MKIGIISDSHDNVESTNNAIKKLEELGAEVLIHCGDFCGPFMIAEIAKFKGQVHACFGNTNDKFLSLQVANKNGVNLHGDYGEVELDGKKIIFNHFPLFAEGLAHLSKYDLVAYGHTHEAKIEKIKNTWLVNPGGLKGYGEKQSFLIYNTETDKINIIEL